MQIFKSKLFIVVLLLVAFASFSVAKFLISVDGKLPLINGVIIPNSQPIKPFRVLDQNNTPFTNQMLIGKWHLLTYGYTNCPDVCPTTLSVLAKLSDKLKAEHQYDDVDVLFYSIDPERDTTSRLAKYLPFFDDSFVGLTYQKDMTESAQALEKSLGMISILTPVEDVKETEIFGSYRVSHGFMLYLINPKGELQAVFRPIKGKAGENYFSEEMLYQDYLSVRDYFG